MFLAIHSIELRLGRISSQSSKHPGSTQDEEVALKAEGVKSSSFRTQEYGQHSKLPNSTSEESLLPGFAH